MSWLGRAAWVAVGAAGAKLLSDPETQKKLREVGRDVRAAVREKAEDVIKYINKLDREDRQREAEARRNAPTEPLKQARGKSGGGRGRRKPAGATA